MQHQNRHRLYRKQTPGGEEATQAAKTNKSRTRKFQENCSWCCKIETWSRGNPLLPPGCVSLPVFPLLFPQNSSLPVFPRTGSPLQLHLGVLQCNSILALSSTGQRQPHRLRVQSHKTSPSLPHPTVLGTPAVSLGYHLCF